MESAHETMSTLNFAARAKLMRNKARVNQDTRGNIDVLRKEVLRLNRCSPWCPHRLDVGHPQGHTILQSKHALWGKGHFVLVCGLTPDVIRASAMQPLRAESRACGHAGSWR